MKYITITTHKTTDGQTITTTTTVDTTDARTAHQTATAAAIADRLPTGYTIRVYPATMDESGEPLAAGIARGAVMVARRTAINGIKRTGGNDTQHRLEREYAAINARIMGAESAARIQSVVECYGHDTQDYYGVAVTALYTAVARGLEIAEQYHAAYLELNAYISALRGASAAECSTEYIMDGGGDVVAYNTAIAQIIRGGDKWTPTEGGTMDADTAAELGAVLGDCAALLNPTQRHIMDLLGRGYSQRQIASMTGREVATVNRNIAIMRGKIADYIRDNAPDFSALIREAETAAAAMAAANGGRTEEGEARHKAAHNAEYYRAYRARKAAERKATQNNA